MKDNQSYYDDFADWYERERICYHALLDRLQIEVMPCAGQDVLELGCGTGLIKGNRLTSPANY